MPAFVHASRMIDAGRGLKLLMQRVADGHLYGHSVLPLPSLPSRLIFLRMHRAVQPSISWNRICPAIGLEHTHRRLILANVGQDQQG